MLDKQRRRADKAGANSPAQRTLAGIRFPSTADAGLVYPLQSASPRRVDLTSGARLQRRRQSREPIHRLLVSPANAQCQAFIIPPAHNLQGRWQSGRGKPVWKR
jgi:hypothetical protein